MAMPAAPEVAAKPRRFDGESPLMISGRSAHDGSFGQKAAAYLPDDSVQRDPRKRVQVFQHIPRSGVGTHLGEHSFAEILAALITMVLSPPN